MSNIQSILNETRVFPPSDAFVKQANVSGMAAYKALCAEAENDYAGFWAKLARDYILWKSRSAKRWMKAMPRSTNGLKTAS